MRPANVANATHEFAKPENWDENANGVSCGDLYVRQQKLEGTDILENVSAWKPSAAELVILNDGGIVEVTLCGRQLAMAVGVGREHGYVSPEPGRPVVINEHAHGDDAHDDRSEADKDWDAECDRS